MISFVWKAITMFGDESTKQSFNNATKEYKASVKENENFFKKATLKRGKNPGRLIGDFESDNFNFQDDEESNQRNTLHKKDIEVKEIELELPNEKKRISLKEENAIGSENGKILNQIKGLEEHRLDHSNNNRVKLQEENQDDKREEHQGNKKNKNKKKLNEKRKVEEKKVESIHPQQQKAPKVIGLQQENKNLSKKYTEYQKGNKQNSQTKRVGVRESNKRKGLKEFFALLMNPNKLLESRLQEAFVEMKNYFSNKLSSNPSNYKDKQRLKRLVPATKENYLKLHEIVDEFPQVMDQFREEQVEFEDCVKLIGKFFFIFLFFYFFIFFVFQIF